MQVLSTGGTSVSPIEGDPRTFTAYMFALVEMDGASLFPSIDLVAFDPFNTPDTIYLESAVLFEIPLP